MTYWCGVVLVCLHVACPVADLQHHVRQPFGPAMCEMLCRQVVGCSAFSFSASSLTCQINSKTIPGHYTQLHEVTSTQGKSKWTPTSGQECPPFSRIILTRTKGVQCVLRTDNQEQIHLFKEGGKRVVFFPITPDKSDLYVLLPHNKSVRTYKEIQLQSVRDIAYVEIPGRLLVSTHRQVLSYTKDKRSPTIVRCVPAQMVVDQKRTLVFMTGRLVKKYVVYRVNDNGAAPKIIFMSITRHRSVTVSPRFTTVYVSFDDELTSFSYYGTNVTPITKGAIIDNLTWDALGEVLYYFSDQYLYEHSVTKNNVTKLKYVREKVHKFRLYGSSVSLLTIKGSNTIFALDLLNLNTKLQKLAVAEGKTNDILMCLIP